MRWPWIGREHHEEVVRAKESQIRWQQETIAALEAKIAQPIPVKVTIQIPEDMMMVAPAVVSRRRPMDAAAPRKTHDDKPIDWASLDENNNEDLARAAAKELGGPVSPYVLNQTVQRIRANIIRDKRERSRRTGEIASVGTIEAPEPGVTSTHPDITPPAHVQRLIDKAAEGIM